LYEIARKEASPIMPRPPRSGVRHAWPDPSKSTALIATLVVVVALLACFDPVFLFNDAFQHVSATRALLEGEGYSTSIIYYEQNYAQGVAPVPQTVWPPGTAVLASVFAFLGIDALWAVALVSVAGLAASAIIMFYVGRHCDLRDAVTTLTALSVIALGLLIYVTFRGGTEGPFIAATLLVLAGACALAYGRVSASGAMLAMAAGAVLAVSLRYNGFFLIVSTGLWFVYRALANRSWKPVTQAIVTLLPASLIGLLLLWRNLRLTGSLTGGPESESWASPTEVITALVQAMVSTSGFDPGEPIQLILLVLLAAALLVSFAGLAMWLVRLARRDHSMSAGERASLEVAVFCILYLVVTLLMLVLILAPRALDALGYRYLLPLLPFLVLLVAIVWHELATGREAPAAVNSWLADRRSGGLVLSIIVGTLLTGNALAFASAFTSLHASQPIRDIPASLNEQLTSTETVGEWLAARVSIEAPVMSSSAQRLGGLTGWPVLGLTPGMYSHSEWPSERAHEVVRQFGVCYVLVHKTDTEAMIGGGRELFADLRRKVVPTWLTLEYQSPLLQIYVVDGCETWA
jgi:hypothetical protein